MTVFKKIIDKEAPATIVFENERIIAIEDIAPVAPVHLLIIPKEEIPDLQSMKEQHYPLMGEIVSVAQELARTFGVSDGYRLLTNNGPSAGQAVFHLHFHLIGGRKLGAIG